MTSDQRQVILERHVRELSEIFDSVQILATFLNSDGRTTGQKSGAGNWYARQGLAHEFISENLAENQADQIAQKLDPPDDWQSSIK